MCIKCMYKKPLYPNNSSQFLAQVGFSHFHTAFFTWLLCLCFDKLLTSHILFERFLFTVCMCMIRVLTLTVKLNLSLFYLLSTTFHPIPLKMHEEEVVKVPLCHCITAFFHLESENENLIPFHHPIHSFPPPQVFPGFYYLWLCA